MYRPSSTCNDTFICATMLTNSLTNHLLNNLQSPSSPNKIAHTTTRLHYTILCDLFAKTRNSNPSSFASRPRQNVADATARTVEKSLQSAWEGGMGGGGSRCDRVRCCSAWAGCSSVDVLCINVVHYIDTLLRDIILHHHVV